MAVDEVMGSEGEGSEKISTSADDRPANNPWLVCLPIGYSKCHF